jgi:glycosyltransferase involved in cell wall biosynthesis
MHARTSRRQKVALVANTSWHLHNFRTDLMKALRDAGHDVVAVAPEDEYTDNLIEAGFAHRHIPLDATGISPVRELRSVMHLRRLLREEGVRTVLSFTPKANIHSGLAIADPTVAFIPNMSGLGRAFSKGSGLLWVAKASLKRAFARATTVLFQNGDDLRLLVDMGVVDAAKARRLPGSGVNLQRFAQAAGNDNDRPDDEIIFLFVARLLWEKGLGEYVAAAKTIKACMPHIRFQVLGRPQPGNGGIPPDIIEAWAQDGAIEFLGASDDVRSHIESADCVVLPSYYREGVPRSLLEGAAMAKPVIACDVPGSRDAVDDRETGYLCRPQSVADLVAALHKVIAMSASERRDMGRRGRAKMEAEFDEAIVINEYLGLVSQTAF